MKKILLYLFIIVLSLSLCLFSCAEQKQNDNNYIEHKLIDNFTFVCVEYNNIFELWVHKETKVIYISQRTCNSGLAVMVDENGNPLLWEGDV